MTIAGYIHLITGIILLMVILCGLCFKVKKVKNPDKIGDQYRAFIYDGYRIIS